jgi:pentatricopeptide repeat protein
MYAKCGSMDDAWRVFKNMPSLTVVSWIAMIFGHVKCGEGPLGIGSFSANATGSLKPNPVNFVGVLNACASRVALEEGRRAHEQIIRSGFESNVFVRNCLIDMYVKCGRMNDAQSVFNKMPSHGVVSWIAMILGHVKCGQGQRGHWTYVHNCRREVWH